MHARLGHVLKSAPVNNLDPKGMPKEGMSWGNIAHLPVKQRDERLPVVLAVAG